MRRFLASLRRDVLLQVRYKLVAVSLFMVAFWSGLLALVPEAFRPEPTLFVPAFVVINLLTTTFYFICGLVLFEKGEDKVLFEVSALPEVSSGLPVYPSDLGTELVQALGRDLVVRRTRDDRHALTGQQVRHFRAPPAGRRTNR